MQSVLLRSKEIGSAAMFALGLSALCTPVQAYADPCGICAKNVVINRDLATCFLSRYEELAATQGAAVAVDLSSCEQNRGGIFEALPQPGMAAANGISREPDLQFIVTHAQLGCLKTKLEDPATLLDPQASIDLSSCGA